MKCNHMVSWTLLLVASGRLVAHPITDSAEMPYAGPASAEERGVSNMDDLSLSEQSYTQQDPPGLRYSPLLSAELHRDGLRASGLLPGGLKREIMLEKQSLQNPFSHFLGIRKQFRKRGGNSECFWKYCV